MQISKKTQLPLLLFLAFAFSLLVRMIWVYQFQDMAQFKFHNSFMINTNDGYYWAEGARDILSGVHQANDLSPISEPIALLTAFLAKILPFSFESIIFYMPAFFSSLVVIPILLIANSIGRKEVGFIAAIFGSVAWSYYNRTMVGYYDTDMLNIVFPMMILWGLIRGIETKEQKYIGVVGVNIFLYSWWYSASYSLAFAFMGMLALYSAYKFYKSSQPKQFFYKDEELHYLVSLVTMMILSMLSIPLVIKAMLVIGYFALLYFKKLDKYLFYIFLLSVALFIFSGGLNPIFSQLKGYIFTSSTKADGSTLSLHFFSVMQTVREAGHISFETFANRISGNGVILVASIVGYIWLVVRNPILLLSLPMVGLGFLALNAGLRFTVYAVPILALGIGYLIYKSAYFLSQQLQGKKAQATVFYGLMGVLSVVILYPNIKHIYDYRVPTVLTNSTATSLDKLKSIASREDYVASWWDYGYPIRYYSDVKTLVDGGKHSGRVNFPVSFALTHPQDVSAKMLRLDVEYTEKKFGLSKKEKKEWQKSNIAQMSLDYGTKDSNQFLAKLSTDIKLPKKTRDVYLYLPYKMLDIFPTISLFSNLNLMTGKAYPRAFFYQTRRFKKMNNGINLGRGIVLNNKTGEITLGRNHFKINNFIITQYDAKKKLHFNIQQIDPHSQINVIYMQSYNTFLVLDNKMLNSTYIQLFVLENYDRNLFEKVILTPEAKIFKLKI